MCVEGVYLIQAGALRRLLRLEVAASLSYIVSYSTVGALSALNAELLVTDFIMSSLDDILGRLIGEPLMDGYGMLRGKLLVGVGGILVPGLFVGVPYVLNEVLFAFRKNLKEMILLHMNDFSHYKSHRLPLHNRTSCCMTVD